LGYYLFMTNTNRHLDQAQKDANGFMSSHQADCVCGHSPYQHGAHASGASPCRHLGCGCSDFDRELYPVTRRDGRIVWVSVPPSDNE
jgi:hypothetical protein